MKQGREISLWAAVAAFFASLLAIGIFDIIDTDLWTEYLGALIVAGITGGAVYAQQRLSFARKAGGEPEKP